jgi:hypothetical protein
VKKETEEYKYPPIVHIQNRLNPSILVDDIEEREDENNKIDKGSKISGLSINTKMSFNGSISARKL